MNNISKTSDIKTDQASTHRTAVVSRGLSQCCPFKSRVRYYKTQSLKDEKIFNVLTGAHTDKKRKVDHDTEENSGSPMMYYL
jgi:hypothetical protein